MRIITDQPFPLLARVKEKFPIPSNVVFAYGEDLYNPSGVTLPIDLMVHEAVHSVQQIIGPDLWWERYLTEDAFRLAQEVQAYGTQYDFFCKGHLDRNVRSRFLYRIAKDLCSPLYGSLCDFNIATQLIRHGTKVPLEIRKMDK